MPERGSDDSSETPLIHRQALRYLSYRPRSRREVVDYLRGKGWDAGELEGEVSWLAELGLVNDADFAGSWIASRQAVRPRSRRRLQQELMAKGVSSDDIEVALAELDEDDELESLVKVIEKQRRIGRYTDEKLQAYLARQGYGYGQIKKALERLDESD